MNQNGPPRREALGPSPRKWSIVLAALVGGLFSSAADRLDASGI